MHFLSLLLPCAVRCLPDCRSRSGLRLLSTSDLLRSSSCQPITAGPACRSLRWWMNAARSWAPAKAIRFKGTGAPRHLLSRLRGLPWSDSLHLMTDPLDGPLLDLQREYL